MCLTLPLTELTIQICKCSNAAKDESTRAYLVDWNKYHPFQSEDKQTSAWSQNPKAFGNHLLFLLLNIYKGQLKDCR